jgi:hypothetical protein
MKTVRRQLPSLLAPACSLVCGLGYRWLNYDFKHDDSELDLLLSGPVVTIQFRF